MAHRSRLLPSLVAVSFAAVLPLTLAAAPDHAEAPATRPASVDHEAHGKLEHSMERMEEVFDKLESDIADPAKAESNLKLLGEFQKCVLDAKSVLPGRVSHLPEADRVKASGEYRGMMVELLRRTLAVEDAVVAGDHAKAVEALKSVHEMEEKGHAKFRKKRPQR